MTNEQTSGSRIDGATGNAPATPTEPEAIRADIERTRAELGDTVEALAAKADVKARTREAASATAARVQQKMAAGAREVQARGGELAHRAAEGASRVQAAVPERARQAGERVRRRPAPVVVTAVGLTVAAAVVVIVVRRRMAAKRAGNRWWRRLP